MEERKRRIAEGAPFAWRLDVGAAMARVGKDLSRTEFIDETLSGTRRVEARPQDWGDVIVARREIPTSYHLAVVVDDALQGAAVARGQDLFPRPACSACFSKFSACRSRITSTTVSSSARTVESCRRASRILVSPRCGR